MVMISLDEFKKCEMRMGTVVVAEPVAGSEKLLRLEVDFGPSKKDSEDREVRQILSGIAKFYKPEDLIGKQMPFIVNLEPRSMMGLESQGMLIAANATDGPVLLMPDKSVPNGSSLC